MNYELENKELIIELDSQSFLMVKINKDHLLGNVINITQLFKSNNIIKKGGTIHLPLNDMGINAIQQLEDFYGVLLREFSSKAKFNEWLNTDNEPKSDGLRRKLESVVSISKEKDKQEILEEIGKERLREPIPNTPFICEDVVYAIINGQPFAETIKVPINQMKPIFFHALMGGRDWVASRIAKHVLELNVEYDSKKTSKILMEFVEAELLKFRKGVNKTGQEYRLYLFSEYKNGME